MPSPCKKRRFVSHGGDVWGFSRKYGIPLNNVLDFSAPINFLGASPKAVETIKNVAHQIKFYPDPNPKELKSEIAKYVGDIESENIIIGNGSIEPIYMIADYFSPDFEAIIPVPSFSEYEKATLRVHGKPVFSKLKEDFSMDIENIKKTTNEKTRVIFICNPHSPSGKLYSREKILEITEFCNKKNIFVCVDENYMEFTELGPKTTVLGYVEKYKNLFVVKSLSKFFGMPGVRFGYGIANKNFICELQDVRQPWSINLLAVFATKAALNDSEFIRNTKMTIAVEKAHLEKMINSIESLHVFPSVTNFLLVKILDRRVLSTTLREKLAKDGILIRDCSTFVGLDNSYFRVTVRSFDQNNLLVDKLKKEIKKIIENYE
jgi:threonine-phosphate decarboxylase